MELTYLGNKNILNLHKTGFFCSRIVSGSAVMNCYDWATEVDIENNVIVSGFQSKIEKDILRFLEKRRARIILVLARSIYKQVPQEFQRFLEDDRLLVVSTSQSATRTAKAVAEHRNEYIAQICDELVFGYIGEGSNLQMIYQNYIEKSNLLSSNK